MTGITDLNNFEDTNPIETLVGDGKKYKTVEELAKAYVHADVYINELKGKLEDQTKTSSKLDEVIKALAKPQAEREPSVDNAQNSPALSKEELEQVVLNTINKKTTIEALNSNTDKAKAELIRLYGGEEGYASAIRTVLKKDPSLKEVLDEMARKSPDSMVEFIQTKVPLPDGYTNAPNVGGGSGGKTPSSIPSGVVSWKESQTIRRKDPKKYYSPEFKQKIIDSKTICDSKGIDYYNT